MRANSRTSSSQLAASQLAQVTPQLVAAAVVGDGATSRRQIGAGPGITAPGTAYFVRPAPNARASSNQPVNVSHAKGALRPRERHCEPRPASGSQQRHRPSDYEQTIRCEQMRICCERIPMARLPGARLPGARIPVALALAAHARIARQARAICGCTACVRCRLLYEHIARAEEHRAGAAPALAHPSAEIRKITV